MISADIKLMLNNKKQKNWWLYLINAHQKYILSKLEIQCKEGVHFLFHSGWYFIQLDIIW